MTNLLLLLALLSGPSEPPEAVFVDGARFEIRAEVEPGLYGSCDCRQRVIRYDPHQPARVVRATIYHETIHAQFCNRRHPWRQEKCTQVHERVGLGVLRDPRNRPWLAYITGGRDG